MISAAERGRPAKRAIDVGQAPPWAQDSKMQLVTAHKLPDICDQSCREPVHTWITYSESGPCVSATAPPCDATTTVLMFTNSWMPKLESSRP